MKFMQLNKMLVLIYDMPKVRTNVVNDMAVFCEMRLHDS